MNMTKSDYSIIYSGILDKVKVFSSITSVEAIYVNVKIHNYHNVYGKPVINMVIIINKVDGLVSDLVDEINASYQVNASIRAEMIHQKEYSTNRFRLTELAESNILYDRYGTYHLLKSSINSIGEERPNPRVIKIEKYSIR